MATLKAGDRVFPTRPMKMTYGYVRAIESEGTLTIYFPELRPIGRGWLDWEFSKNREQALHKCRIAYAECKAIGIF